MNEAQAAPITDDRTKGRARRAQIAAGAVLLVVLTALAADLRVTSLAGEIGEQGSLIVFAMPGLTFGIVGALLIWRRPENTVGWLFGLVGVLLTTGSLLDGYARYVFEIRSEPLPGGVFAAWYSEWWWIPFLFTVLVFLPLLFPTGRLLSRRWRPLLGVALVTMTIGIVVAMLDPQLDWSGAQTSVENPIGVSGIEDLDDSESGTFIFMGFFACIIGSAVSLILRFRRSAGTERQQLKLFTYSSAIFVLIFLGNGILDFAFGVQFPTLLEGTIALPAIGAGAAIMRYRLYDIDLFINRTIVYSVLTAALAAAYLGGVALAQLILPVSGDNQFVVAGTTLAVAALFNPARRKVQAGIDHIFYRRKYDAQRTIDGFSARLRDEVDLEAISLELAQAVQTTMQPAHVSLWLRDGASLEAAATSRGTGR